MKDIAGVEVAVGDVVAYAWSRGSASPIMKVGVVAKLTPKGVSVKTKGGGTRSIIHFHQRGIVVNKTNPDLTY